MKFVLQSKGYCPEDVDAHVALLQGQIRQKDANIARLKEKMAQYSSQEANISLAITAAIEKAKEIERISKIEREFAREKVMILYSRYEVFLNEMVKKYPAVSVENVREKMQQLREEISDGLVQDFNIKLTHQTTADPMKLLLSRMANKAEEPKQKPSPAVVIRRETPTVYPEKSLVNRLEEKAKMIKPIADKPLDDFLNDDQTDASAYAKTFEKSKEKWAKATNGFNLEEAVTPTEDLEEIMKAFDFFDTSENK